jgi:septal ring factor EnvC (AmiA/AmiB activator)
VAWAFCAFALLCLYSPARLPASEPSESARTLLLESLREADATLTQLEALWPMLSAQVSETGQRLVQAQKQLDSLRAELTLWQESSAEWEKASQESQAALARVQTSLAELERRYVGLLRSWSAYRTEMLKQAESRELALRRWRVVAIAGIPAAALLGVLAVLVASE